MALSGDFIVGFPGETEADFAGDARAGRGGRLRAGLSPSPTRRGRARRRRGGRRCRRRCRSERLQRLQALLERGSRRRSRPGWSGGCCRCWSRSRGGTRGRWSGDRPISTRCTSTRRQELRGAIVPARIVAAGANSLAGELAERRVTTRSRSRLHGQPGWGTLVSVEVTELAGGPLAITAPNPASNPDDASDTVLRVSRQPAADRPLRRARPQHRADRGAARRRDPPPRQPPGAARRRRRSARRPSRCCARSTPGWSRGGR